MGWISEEIDCRLLYSSGRPSHLMNLTVREDSLRVPLLMREDATIYVDLCRIWWRLEKPLLALGVGVAGVQWRHFSIGFVQVRGLGPVADGQIL